MLSTFRKCVNARGKTASLYQPFYKVFRDLWRSEGDKNNKKKAQITFTLAKWIEKNYPDEVIK